MKKQIVIASTLSLLSIFSAAACADTLASERALQKKIQETTEQQRAADAKKYERVSALAGDKRGELAAKKDEVANTYNKWQEQKAAADAAKNTDANKYKAVEAAAEKHAQANKQFMDMQKEILAKNGALADGVVLAEAINALNAAAPSAAGR
ncbi:MAG: hypothetical protein HYZ46_08025 [Nitrosomonadales bacterium]|nr:hypothetical protein [Nitrosomonadales bacterium]